MYVHDRRIWKSRTCPTNIGIACAFNFLKCWSKSFPQKEPWYYQFENEPKSPVHIMKARLSRFSLSWSHIVVTCSISVSQLNIIMTHNLWVIIYGSLVQAMIDQSDVRYEPESISSIVKFLVSFAILWIGEYDEIVIIFISTEMLSHGIWVVL